MYFTNSIELFDLGTLKHRECNDCINIVVRSRVLEH